MEDSPYKDHHGRDEDGKDDEVKHGSGGLQPLQEEPRRPEDQLDHLSDNVQIAESIPNENQDKADGIKHRPTTQPPKLPAPENIDDLRNRVQHDILKEERH